MRYREALEYFNSCIKPLINKSDKPAIREAGNNFIDDLHRDGLITDRQAQTWIIPDAKSRGEARN